MTLLWHTLGKWNWKTTLYRSQLSLFLFRCLSLSKDCSVVCILLVWLLHADILVCCGWRLEESRINNPNMDTQESVWESELAVAASYSLSTQTQPGSSKLLSHCDTALGYRYSMPCAIMQGENVLQYPRKITSGCYNTMYTPHSLSSYNGLHCRLFFLGSSFPNYSLALRGWIPAWDWLIDYLAA